MDRCIVGCNTLILRENRGELKKWMDNCVTYNHRNVENTRIILIKLFIPIFDYPLSLILLSNLFKFEIRDR